MTTVAAKQIAARKMYGGTENSIPAYLEQEVLLWSPEKLTLKTYDLFLLSARKRDVKRMSNILSELISALNFEVGEISQRLYRLYEYCQSCVATRRYDEAAEIINGLRVAWQTTFNLSS